MEKYIKANTVLKFINSCLEHEDKITDIEKVVLIGIKTCVERIPAADVVEVVRCGECKYYNDKLEMYSDYVCTIRHYCDGSPIIVGKDDFCSSGKHKDEGQKE